MKHTRDNEISQQQIQEMKKIQRVYRLTASSDALEALIDDGLDSAYEIINSTLDTHAGSVTLSSKQLAWIAYFIWKNESEPNSRGILHWLEAETRLSGQVSK